MCPPKELQSTGLSLSPLDSVCSYTENTLGCPSYAAKVRTDNKIKESILPEHLSIFLFTRDYSISLCSTSQFWIVIDFTNLLCNSFFNSFFPWSTDKTLYPATVSALTASASPCLVVALKHLTIVPHGCSTPHRFHPKHTMLYSNLRAHLQKVTLDVFLLFSGLVISSALVGL